MCLIIKSLRKNPEIISLIPIYSYCKEKSYCEEKSISSLFLQSAALFALVKSPAIATYFGMNIFRIVKASLMIV
jgi:hypothetical protein